LEFGSNVLRNFRAVTRINFVKMSAEPIFDILATLAERSRNVGDDVLTVLLSEHIVEESARLLVVVVRVLVRVSAHSS